LFTVKKDKKTLKNTDCLVVVILTHGNQDGVFATDRLMKIKTLMDHFSAENCVCLMVFNATFNNISVISWQSVLLVEETGVPGENHRPAASH
jgi:hypothetical protein